MFCLRQLTDVAPGDHRVEIKGGERYADEANLVHLAANESKDLGVVSLKVVRGLAHFDVRTKGDFARLGFGPRTPSGDGRGAPRRCRYRAGLDTRSDQARLRRGSGPAPFEDGAEKTFVVELSKHGLESAKTANSGGAPAEAQTQTASRALPSHTEAPRAEMAHAEALHAAPAALSTGSGPCKVNINSMPPAGVVVDGRPLGTTPKVGVSVDPGAHNVVFMRSDSTKKAVSVTCKGGESKTVAVHLSAAASD